MSEWLLGKVKGISLRKKGSLQIVHDVGLGGRWEEVSTGAKMKDEMGFWNGREATG